MERHHQLSPGTPAEDEVVFQSVKKLGLVKDDRREKEEDRVEEREVNDKYKWILREIWKRLFHYSSHNHYNNCNLL